MIYSPFEVVVVPFPFTDSSKTKRRPALVLSQYSSFSSKNNHSVLAMITSQKNDPWPLDVIIEHPQPSGLTASSVVRMKIFTLDHIFILRKIGQLSKTDQEQVKQSLSKLFESL